MYVPNLISIPFVLSKIWPIQESIMKKWLRGNNYVNILGMIMVHVHFLSLTSFYKPNFISIWFVLSKIRLGQASIMTNTKLRGDNSINIQNRIMVLGNCPSSYYHLSINQVSSKSLLYFSRYRPDRQQL